MEFFSDTGAVLLNGLRAALFGACAGLALEVVNAWDLECRPGRKALFAADTGFCLCAAAGFFTLLLKYADGSLRALWFACAAAGWAACARILGRPAKKLFRACFRISRRVRRAVSERVLTPAAKYMKKTLDSLRKPLIFLSRCIKMTISIIKSGKIRRKIARRKRRWLQEREKAQRKK